MAFGFMGPIEPEAGHRFNPNKLLLDPYARAHAGKLVWDPAVFGYTIGVDGDDLTLDERDSAPFVPKSVVVDPNFDWRGEYRRRNVPWDRTIIYETHVKGFTKLHPEVDERLRGFYAGLGSKPVVDYIRSLGVTTVELLPVHTFVDDSFLLERGLKNYWGYNSIGFFAPDPRYAADVPNSLREFKEMIARLHDGGLEVILDVVYNHTAEGNERGPTLSFKGIDNRSYYRLLPDQPRYYINDTGTGNTLNLSHPRVIQMVADSLRYWVSETRVDGFRFDLGTILAREPDGFNTESGFLKADRAGSAARRGQADRRALGLRARRLSGRRLPAGMGGMERHIPRHGARLLARRGERQGAWRRAFALRPTNSTSAAASHGRASISSPRTTASPCAISSPTTTSTTKRTARTTATATRTIAPGTAARRDRPTIPQFVSLRLRQMRNFLATLILSQGTPMIRAGDEFGRTQNGNNNAYCQDNEISWLNWKLDEEQSSPDRVFPPPDGVLSPLSGSAPVAVFHRRDEPGHRRQGCDLDRRQWVRNDARNVGQRIDPLLRHAARRARRRSAASSSAAGT